MQLHHRNHQCSTHHLQSSLRQTPACPSQMQGRHGLLLSGTEQPPLCVSLQSMGHCWHRQVFLAAEHSCVPLSCSLFAFGLLWQRSKCSVKCSADTSTWQSPDTRLNTCNTALVKPDKAILLSACRASSSERQRSWKARRKQPLTSQCQGCPAAKVLAYEKCSSKTPACLGSSSRTVPTA